MKTIHPAALRARWRNLEEVALLDVREEGPFAAAHPFFAVSLPLSRLELRIGALVPRLDCLVVVYDDDEGLAPRAAAILSGLGYTQVMGLDGDLTGYAAFGEIFQDVNAPSKAFGELVEAIRHTPSLAADDVAALIENEPDLVVLDARRFEEFRTMSVPRGISVPGGELVRRVGDIAPSATTTVIVNCAGRTRSIIGAQSLVNAGVPNPVFALRNGTIGWTLAGHRLERGQTRRYGPHRGAEHLTEAKRRADHWARSTGVRAINAVELARLRADTARTLYCLDVRSPEEHAAGHPEGFGLAPGGQLVQALDEWVAVRGARVVLFDDDGVRARMAASWLVQMGCDAMVIGADDVGVDVRGEATRTAAAAPPAGGTAISAAALADILAEVTVLDLAPSPVYRAGHIPGARFVVRARVQADLHGLDAGRVVLTSPDGLLAQFARADVQAAVPTHVYVLEGGTDAWQAAGHAITHEDPVFLSVPDDVYKRPYEGTDNDAAAMQAYIDWEHGLVAQLANDGVCRFRVM